MAQKNKVKELVGRGLNSYHTKALQQMDRIEKKNKEQNHKISILSNELDNDYLTKAEEGSVISLEHSKEGMVYLDELQGNTLVNYCTDGSKELTLNGDIDVEGTFVTTTEGVDNGKVDIMCEGNTLVNLVPNGRFKNNKQYWLGGNFFTTFSENDEIVGIKMSGVGKGHHIRTDYLPIKQNTEYTLIYSMKNTSTNNSIWTGIYYTDESGAQKYLTIENYDRNNYSSYVQKKIRFTTLQGSDFNVRLYNYCDGDESNTLYIKDVMVLEGDWTNKEVPSEFFEGMKSVGQDDENGHSIEIEAKNKNLLNVGFERGAIDDKTGMPMGGGPNVIRPKSHIRIKPNTTYAYTRDGVFVDAHKYFYDINKNYIGKHNSLHGLFTSPSNAHYFKCYYGGTVDNNVDMLEEASVENPYVAPQTNKKSIPLNEPLRGLPNGIKDRFVKQGSKWYVERNCREIVFNGSEGSWMASSTNGNVATSLFYIKQSDRLAQSIGLCDRFSTLSGYGTNEPEGVFYGIDINIRINVNKLKTNDLEGFKEWLQQNPTTIVYQLATPTYEEITDPQVITYLDTTHISNNSTIPCNMQTKNSGYNTIIKPSTLYTVALDSNKSGTIGINLGGAKVTTTNNVATITTPATLADDSLRLYGKGIKGSKVRLLEGDKTNWIPSHFEGMKSSFEDKVQDDGSYKMEILSEDKNKLNGYNFARNIFNSVKNSVLDTENKTIKYNASDIDNVILKSIKFKKNTRYTIILKGFNSNEDMQSTNINVIYTDGSSQPINNFIDGISVVVTFEGKTVSHLIGNWSTLTTTLYYDECGIFEGVNVPFEPYKYHNKIQFLLNEPLRGVGDLKDKFVFKDNKLMIERNCQVTILDGNNELWAYEQMYGSIYNNKMLFLIKDKTASNFNPNINGDYHSDRLNRINGLTEYYNEGFILREDKAIGLVIESHRFNNVYTTTKLREWLSKNPLTIVYQLTEPTYEEIPFELQKIILEGYENGTLFFDTNIPPTVTTTYAGETPIVKSVKLNKTEVLNNTNDINDNIIPYLMDMDYRVVCLQLQSEEFNNGVAMARLFGGTYEMLQRDIQSKRYSVDEYRYRLDAYLSANKITEEEYNKLGDMLNE